MKICKIMDLAMESGTPVIGLCDSGGARIQEGVDALGGYAEIFYRNVSASGRIPQISAILGPCAGGAVYSPAITDFVFMVEGTSHMFITGPEVIKAATGEVTDFEELGGAEAHSTRSGVCHFVANSEHDCFRQIRELMEFLPQNCFERPSGRPPQATEPRSAALDRIARQEAKRPSGPRGGRELADDRASSKSTLRPEHRRGFIRLAGRRGRHNNPLHLPGRSTSPLGEGPFAPRRLNIPLLTLVDVPGYWPGVEQEHGGIIRKGAKLLYAYCQATVPKVTVVLKKAYGGAYDVMSSKHVRGDFNFAWPCAEIAVMGPQGAVNILFAREIRKAAKPEERRKELIDEYTKRFSNPYLAASRGYIDEVIEARRTRSKVVNAFRFLRTRRCPASRRGMGIRLGSDAALCRLRGRRGPCRGLTPACGTPGLPNAWRRRVRAGGRGGLGRRRAVLARPRRPLAAFLTAVARSRPSVDPAPGEARPRNRRRHFSAFAGRPALPGRGRAIRGRRGVFARAVARRPMGLWPSSRARGPATWAAPDLRHPVAFAAFSP